MPLTLNDRQTRRLGQSLRQGAVDALRIADALDPAGRTHHLIGVNDMGQFAKDWDALKGIIRQKDDALERQSAQIAAQAQQIAALQQQLSSASSRFDTDDQKAATELHQTITDNAPAQPAAAPASAKDVTVFKK